MYMTQGLHRTLQRRPGTRRCAIWAAASAIPNWPTALRASRAACARSGSKPASVWPCSRSIRSATLNTSWRCRGPAGAQPRQLPLEPGGNTLLLDDSETSVLIVDETFKNIGARLVGEAKTLRQVIYAGDGEVPPACCPTRH